MPVCCKFNSYSVQVSERDKYCLKFLNITSRHYKIYSQSLADPKKVEENNMYFLASVRLKLLLSNNLCMYLKFFRCPDGFKIVFYHNEKIIKFLNCEDKICSMEKFQKLLSQKIAKYCLHNSASKTWSVLMFFTIWFMAILIR